MRDRHISALHVAAGVLWVLGATLAVIYMAVGIRGTGCIGLLLAGAGGITNVRAMLAHMEERERRAFELGRDHERSRHLHSTS